MVPESDLANVYLVQYAIGTMYKLRLRSKNKYYDTLDRFKGIPLVAQYFFIEVSSNRFGSKLGIVRVSFF